MKPEPGQCSCGAEWATVMLATPQGAVAVGQRCAGIIEAVAKLQGLEPKRTPLMQVVK